MNVLDFVPMDTNTVPVIVKQPTLVSRKDCINLSTKISVGARDYQISHIVKGVENISSEIDSFFPISLYAAMKENLPLKIEGVLSRRLAENHKIIQLIVNSWWPTYRLIPVDYWALSKKPITENVKRSVGCFFTGGIDSFYSFLKRNSEINRIIICYGLDIRLDNHALREKVSTELKKIANHYNKSIIEVETDVRNFSDDYGDWGHQMHGPALAGIAMLLSKELHKVYIASSNPFGLLEPWGTHPLIDPFWSTDAIEIVHDGCEATRVQKAQFVSQDLFALNAIRVCHENRSNLYNCGICEKCVRSMVNLAITNTLQQCQAFDNPLEYWRIRRIKLDTSLRREWLTNLVAAKKANCDPALVDAIEDCVSGIYYMGIKGWPKRALNLLHKMTLASKTAHS